MLKKIRERDLEVKVILLSAIGQESYLNEAKKLGASAYFSKPFSPKELVARIREMFPDVL